MRIRHIAGRVRGRNLDLELPAPLTVLSGYTGAGKTSAVQTATWVQVGAVDLGHKRARKEADVHAALAADGEVLDATVTFDDGGYVRRRLVPGSKGGKPTFTTELGASFARGKPGEVQAAILDRLGDVTAVDLGVLLALGPGDRRKRLIDLCEAQAAPWSDKRIEERLRHHIGVLCQAQADAALMGGDDVPLSPGAVLALAGTIARLDGEAFYEALVRTVDDARRRFLDCRGETKDSKAAIEELTRQAAEGEASPDPERVRAQIATLTAEIEKLERRSGEARQAAARREGIEDQIRNIQESPAAEALRTRAADLLESREIAEGELHELLARGEPVHVPNPDIEEMNTEREMLEAQLAERRAAEAALRARVDEVERTIWVLNSPSDGCEPGCPTCRQPVGAGVLATLDAMRNQGDAEALEVATSVVDLQTELEMLVTTIDEMKAADLRAREAIAEQVAESKARVRELRRDLADRGPLDGTELARQIEQADRAADRIDALRKELAGIEQSDPDEIVQSLAERRTTRTAAERTLREATAAAERDAAYKRAVEQRDSAEQRLHGLDLAGKSWAAVRNEYGAGAVAPLTDVAGLMLPAGWSISVEIESAGINVDRPGLPRVLVDSLSQGEQAIVFGACSAALASMSGVALRLVIVDHAESLTDEPSPDGSAVGGLLVDFVSRLAGAVEQGLVDQVILATGRLTESERLALEAIDHVAVVRVGAPRTPGAPPRAPTDDVEDPSADIDEDAAAIDPDDDGAAAFYSGDEVARMRAAVNRLGAADVRKLYLRVLRADPADRVPLLRARAIRIAANAGVLPGTLLDFCESAARGAA